jgi:dGTPase
MRDNGGFEHNLQGLRVVTSLEKRHPGFPGLNLTYEVREGIIKHSSSWDKPDFVSLTEYEPLLQPTLEGQLIDLADEIAYNNHDIDDGLEAGYISLGELMEIKLWKETSAEVERRMPGITGREAVCQTISRLIGTMMQDLVEETERTIAEGGVGDLCDVRNFGTRLVRRSLAMEEKNRELKKFLMAKLYRHPKVETMRFKAERFLTDLFGAYVENPGLLSASLNERAKKEGLHRVVCDAVASMTDRQCIDEYRRLFDPYQKV